MTTMNTLLAIRMELSLMVETNQYLPSVSCEEMIGTQTLPARNEGRNGIKLNSPKNVN